MPLELSPLTPADIDAYMSIRQAAFGSTVYQILFSGQPSAATVAQAKTSIENMLLNPTNAHFLKVTDTETGEVIAGAKWKAILTDEERERELEMPEPSEEADPRCFREFMRLLSEVKGGVMGVRAYWMLDALTTHPDHHRRGAGALLTEWGIQQADEAGLETYLEASEMGRPLYERYGFEVVRDMPFDMGKYGKEGGVMELKAMVRQPRRIP